MYKYARIRARSSMTVFRDTLRLAYTKSRCILFLFAYILLLLLVVLLFLLLLVVPKRGAMQSRKHEEKQERERERERKRGGGGCRRRERGRRVLGPCQWHRPYRARSRSSRESPEWAEWSLAGRRTRWLLVPPAQAPQSFTRLPASNDSTTKTTSRSSQRNSRTHRVSSYTRGASEGSFSFSRFLSPSLVFWPFVFSIAACTVSPHWPYLIVTHINSSYAYTPRVFFTICCASCSHRLSFSLIVTYFIAVFLHRCIPFPFLFFFQSLRALVPSIAFSLSLSLSLLFALVFLLFGYQYYPSSYDFLLRIAFLLDEFFVYLFPSRIEYALSLPYLLFRLDGGECACGLVSISLTVEIPFRMLHGWRNTFALLLVFSDDFDLRCFF